MIELSDDIELNIHISAGDWRVDDEGKMTLQAEEDLTAYGFTLSITDEVNKIFDKKVGRAVMIELPENDMFDQSYDTLDAVSADLSALWVHTNKLIDKTYEEYDLKAVFLLDQLEIDEEYRGLGLGHKFVQYMQDVLESLKLYDPEEDIVLVIASPTSYDRESSDFQDGHNRLVKFYEANGFKPYLKEITCTYMALNL